MAGMCVVWGWMKRQGKFKARQVKFKLKSSSSQVKSRQVEMVVSSVNLVLFGTGGKAMKASCIGAAGMTSGFGPSYQECL